ncbi:hypothetical protein PTSG_07152 [Salpingoeca rosetta]|uniref:Transmembrane protein n=1 Tax=Salpingoeca rosetta (strain ATCC 50818 / BSB-021) TaxID=946362 RepID=F2UE77_SALR5|nr:uncharacterized protein PTSG_07152 [Salpingoeca rosetta]EGD74927.1 hypothetical protein PTSG_07152 [Salpingoeca rosetta]|eukprot:XP_004992572.1 hypothetical protein PTSG_07152 [Salpingoeca rosetta]
MIELRCKLSVLVVLLGALLLVVAPVFAAETSNTEGGTAGGSSSSSSSSSSSDGGGDGVDTENEASTAGSAVMNTASAKAARLVLHQIAIVLIPIYVIVSINKYYPLTAYLFRGLKWSVPPRAQELIQFSKQKSLERDANGDIQDFEIARSSRVIPKKRELTLRELWKLQYIGDVTELLIVTSSTLAATLGFIGWAFVTGNSLNFNSAAFFLSCLGVFECVKVLTTLGFNGGRYEISVNILCAFIWFFLALVMWLSMNQHIAVQGGAMYEHMQTAARDFLQESQLDPARLIFPEYRSMVLLAAAAAAAIGGLLTFPSFRFARAYASALVVHREKPTLTLQSYTLLVLRSTAVAATLLLRAVTTRTLMQAYLDIAQERMAQLGGGQTKKEKKEQKKANKKKGKKTETKTRNSKSNASDDDVISAGVVQRLVSNIWDYAGVAVLQIITPPLLLLFAAAVMVMRSTGGEHQDAAVSPWGELGTLAVWWISLTTTALTFIGYALLRVSGAVPNVA